MRNCPIVIHLKNILTALAWDVLFGWNSIMMGVGLDGTASTNALMAPEVNRSA